jgi:phospholipid/cholesterol/gamma-HCH transport system permease protein
MAAIPGRVGRRLYTVLHDMGDQLLFHAKVLGWSGRAVRRYKVEILRLLAQVTLGRGALALVAGTIGIVVLETTSIGAVVGLFGYEGLKQIGAEAFTGFMSAYFNTREVVPIVAANALIATVGAGFTAEIGAMRSNEEIDALEVMAVPSIPYLITTRLIAAMLAIVPLYTIALFSSYLATAAVAVGYYGQTPELYGHYFDLFLPPVDIVYSFAKALIFTILLTLIMCYYGYRASGGPAGVGVAVGRAVRLALVTVIAVDFVFNLAVWGSSSTVRIAG